MQPFAQSATFKLLSLRFTLMITFNHHKFFKCVIFEGTSFRPKNFETLNKRIHVFPEDSGGNTKWLKTSTAIVH